jgi:adenylosuccinate lyase
MVQRNAMQAVESNGSFHELVKEDEEIRRYLSEEDIDSCFELEYYLKNVDKIFKRVFGA